MDLPALIQQCAPNVAPVTQTALMKVESTHVPHAIGYKIVGPDKTVYFLDQQPSSRNEAILWARWLVQNKYRFDAGIAQVNSINFKRLGLTPENMFDPCTNIRASATILAENYERAVKQYGPGQRALLAAISAYNSGNFRTGFSNGYVQKVVRAANSTPNLTLKK